MADPTNKIPHLLGIALDNTGVANTQVVALNLSTGERLVGVTDSGKLIVFDVANFTSGYTNADIIKFENVGSSTGMATITINTSVSGGFQETTISCTAALTIGINL